MHIVALQLGILLPPEKMPVVVAVQVTERVTMRLGPRHRRLERLDVRL